MEDGEFLFAGDERTLPSDGDVAEGGLFGMQSDVDDFVHLAALFVGAEADVGHTQQHLGRVCRNDEITVLVADASCQIGAVLYREQDDGGKLHRQPFGIDDTALQTPCSLLVALDEDAFGIDIDTHRIEPDGLHHGFMCRRSIDVFRDREVLQFVEDEVDLHCVEMFINRHQDLAQRHLAEVGDKALCRQGRSGAKKEEQQRERMGEEVALHGCSSFPCLPSTRRTSSPILTENRSKWLSTLTQWSSEASRSHCR